MSEVGTDTTVISVLSALASALAALTGKVGWDRWRGNGDRNVTEALRGHSASIEKMSAQSELLLSNLSEAIKRRDERELLRDEHYQQRHNELMKALSDLNSGINRLLGRSDRERV